MLLEFSVGNFRSFKDPVTFSMVAAPLAARKKELDEHNAFESAGGLKVLKSAALYGANASGKSNLVKSIGFMRQFVIGSSKDTQADEAIDVEAFRLSTETEGGPSFFEAIFCIDGTRYRYGFEVDKGRVHSEWLYHIPSQRETKLFVREGDDFALSGAFKKEGEDLPERTRSNALFLSVAAQFNGAISQRIVRWFKNIKLVSGLQDFGYRSFTIKSFENEAFRTAILRFVTALDLGISDISVESAEMSEDVLPKSMPSELKKMLVDFGSDHHTVATVHRKFGGDGTSVGTEVFDMSTHESEGTNKIFSLAGPLIDVLWKGMVLVADELDARLHPLITAEIIKLFNSRVTNPKNAQLLFTTHDTNLLSNQVFRRDQIWFAEKNRVGATDLYSLAEYKIDRQRVRNDASFEKDYVAGRYGAIPFVGGLERVLGE